MSSAGTAVKGARARGEMSGVLDLDAHVEYCRAAEACEIDSLLTAFGFHRPDPIVLAAALAPHTSTVRFMIACRSGVMSPTLFVQQINTLSAVCNGRVCVNVVAGHTPDEQRSYGDFLEHDERYARSDEFLRVCRELWAGTGPVTFTGRYYRVENAKVSTPFSSPAGTTGPEIFLGGKSGPAIALAAEHAACMWTLPDAPERLAPRIRPLLDAGTEAGLLVSMIARPSREEALAAGREMIGRLGDDSRRAHREFARRSDSVAFTSTLAMGEQREDWLTPWLWVGAVPFLGAPAVAIVGSYDDVAAGILAYRAVGVTQFLFMGWPDLEEMSRFHAHVLPRVRRAEAAAGPAGVEPAR